MLDMVVVGLSVEDVMRNIIFGTGGASYLFGTWIPIMGVLMVFIVLDVITGIMKGFYDSGLRSRKMSQGMITKAMMFVVIIIANMLDYVMLDFTLLNEVPIAKISVITFYLGLEGLSILENLGQMNVPLPKFIVNSLEVLKERGDKSNDKA